jgi:hypothetical protein
MELEKPIEELIKAVVHEFYGDSKIDAHLYSHLFMNKRLCNIRDLLEFYCTMQDLLYKSHDPTNPLI